MFRNIKTQTRWLTTTFCAFALFLTLAGTATAQTHVYPGDSIQDAVNTTNWGGTIYIHPGTYTQFFNVWKDLAIFGISDGSGNPPHITSDYPWGTISVDDYDPFYSWPEWVHIENLRVTNTDPYSPIETGEAICVLRNWSGYGKLTLVDCIISDCRIRSIENYGELDMYRTHIINNNQYLDANAQAIYNIGALRLFGCTISGNNGQNESGNIIYSSLETPYSELIFDQDPETALETTIEYGINTIYGIYLDVPDIAGVDEEVVFRNTHLKSNDWSVVTVNHQYSQTPGFVLYDNALIDGVDLECNVDWEFRHSTFMPMYGVWGAGTGAVSGSIVYGDLPINTFVEYSNLINSTLNGNGVIHTDPLFVDAANDNYHIRWDSPCLDTGTPWADLDYDHTQSDMGYHRIYNVVTLSGVEDLDLAKGWYHVTDDVTGSNLQLPAGSVIHFDDGKTISVEGSPSGPEIFYLGQPDDERTAITYENTVDHLGAITITGNNFGGSQFLDELKVYHLRYDQGEGTLSFNKLKLTVDDLNFIECTNMFMVGNECSGTVKNSSFSGTYNGSSIHQLVMLFNSVSLQNCEFGLYTQNGMLLSNCTHPADQPYSVLDVDGTIDELNEVYSQTGILSLNSSIRYEECMINHHTQAGLRLSLGLGNLSNCAHNNLNDNNLNEGMALIYIAGNPVKLKLNCGYNSFFRGTDMEYQDEMYVMDQSGMIHTSVDVEYNYWEDPPTNPALYLPTNWGVIDYDPLLNSWIAPSEPCPCTTTGGGPKGDGTDDECDPPPEEIAFQTALDAEIAEDYSTAIELYGMIIAEYSSSGAALESVYRLKYLGHNYAEHTASVLYNCENMLNSLDDADLTAGLTAAYWWLHGVHEDVVMAMTSLEELIDDPDQDAYTLLYQDALLYLQIFQDAGGTFGAPGSHHGELLTIQQEEYLQQIGQLLEVPTPTEQGAVPTSIQLSQNYPNPFNPVTTLSYQLSTGMDVELTVYNIKGQQVAQLVSGWQSAGEHSIQFDGGSFSSGLYFYSLTASGQTLTRKMVLVK